jgi:hypothetical protein
MGVRWETPCNSTQVRLVAAVAAPGDLAALAEVLTAERERLVAQMAHIDRQILQAAARHWSAAAAATSSLTPTARARRVDARSRCGGTHRPRPRAKRSGRTHRPDRRA